MSSWPPHLPIAITASRAVARASPTRGAGDRQRRLEGAGGEVGELGGGVVDAEVVGQVAGGEPEQEPAVLHAQRVDRLARPAASATGVGVARVGADRRAAAPSRTAYAAGRVRAERRVGQLAPLLGVPARGGRPAPARAEHASSSRIAVPSSSASSAQQRRRGRRPRSASRHQRRRAPGRGRRCGRAARAAARPASPSARELGQRARRGRGSRAGAASPVLVRGRSSAHSPAGVRRPASAANDAASGRQAASSSARGVVDRRRSRASWSMPLRHVASRGRRRPTAASTRPSTSGCSCTPHTRRREPRPPAPRRPASRPAATAPVGQRR